MVYAMSYARGKLKSMKNGAKLEPSVWKIACRLQKDQHTDSQGSQSCESALPIRKDRLWRGAKQAVSPKKKVKAHSSDHAKGNDIAALYDLGETANSEDGNSFITVLSSEEDIMAASVDVSGSAEQTNSKTENVQSVLWDQHVGQFKVVLSNGFHEWVDAQHGPNGFLQYAFQGALVESEVANLCLTAVMKKTGPGES